MSGRIRAADDFDLIRTRLEEERRLRTEALLCECTQADDSAALDNAKCPVHGKLAQSPAVAITADIGTPLRTIGSKPVQHFGSDSWEALRKSLGLVESVRKA